MDDEDKKVLKLVQKSKEKPPEETPGVTPDDLLKEGIGNYESLILVGWSGDHFKVSWNLGLTPDEVYVLLDLAKSRLMANMYEF
jgi:hypothetical protein